MKILFPKHPETSFLFPLSPQIVFVGLRWEEMVWWEWERADLLAALLLACTPHLSPPFHTIHFNHSLSEKINKKKTTNHYLPGKQFDRNKNRSCQDSSHATIAIVWKEHFTKSFGQNGNSLKWHDTQKVPSKASIAVKKIVWFELWVRLVDFAITCQTLFVAENHFPCI